MRDHVGDERVDGARTSFNVDLEPVTAAQIPDRPRDGMTLRDLEYPVAKADVLHATGEDDDGTDDRCGLGVAHRTGFRDAISRAFRYVSPSTIDGTTTRLSAGSMIPATRCSARSTYVQSGGLWRSRTVDSLTGAIVADSA